MTDPRNVESAGPLADLRVIDLATVVAGPGCARYLGDFGADVIKVERPPGGDSVRSMGWIDPADGSSIWWKLISRNKRTISLDLKDPDDFAVARRLIDSADVLVENFRPGTLERLGLGPDVLHRTNPRLVITRVTGFGQSGPYRDRPGFARVFEAMGGLTYISGEAQATCSIRARPWALRRDSRLRPEPLSITGASLGLMRVCHHWRSSSREASVLPRPLFCKLSVRKDRKSVV